MSHWKPDIGTKLCSRRRFGEVTLTAEQNRRAVGGNLETETVSFHHCWQQKNFVLNFAKWWFKPKTSAQEYQNRTVPTIIGCILAYACTWREKNRPRIEQMLRNISWKHCRYITLRRDSWTMNGEEVRERGRGSKTRRQNAPAENRKDITHVKMCVCAIKLQTQIKIRCVPDSLSVVCFTAALTRGGCRQGASTENTNCRLRLLEGISLYFHSFQLYYESHWRLRWAFDFKMPPRQQSKSPSFSQ